MWWRAVARRALSGAAGAAAGGGALWAAPTAGWCIHSDASEEQVEDERMLKRKVGRERGKGPHTVLATPGMHSLRDELLKVSEARSPGLLVKGFTQHDVFPDGTPNVRVAPAEISGRHVVLLCDYDSANSGRNWLATLGLIYALPRYGTKSFTVVLPFFPVGTMERVSVEGEIATAATFSRMLSATPLTEQGPARFVFYDIHALQNRFYFRDQVLPILATAIPLVHREMDRLVAQGEKVAIAFPDDGAKKRFSPLFTGPNGDLFPSIVCSKVREGGKRFIKVTEGLEDIAGSHCVIIDDLVQTGGTMINCKNLLFKEGAKRVSGYVTHGVFPNGSWERFLEDAPCPPGAQPFANFWVTDSMPHTAGAVHGKAPFKVLSLAPEVHSLLERLLPPPSVAFV